MGETPTWENAPAKSPSLTSRLLNRRCILRPAACRARWDGSESIKARIASNSCDSLSCTPTSNESTLESRVGASDGAWTGPFCSRVVTPDKISSSACSISEGITEGPPIYERPSQRDLNSGYYELQSIPAVTDAKYPEVAQQPAVQQDLKEDS